MSSGHRGSNPFPHDGENSWACTGCGCNCDEQRYGHRSGSGGGGGPSFKSFLIILVIASVAAGFNESLGALILIIWFICIMLK